MTSLVLCTDNICIDTCHFLAPEYAVSGRLASKIFILWKAVIVAVPLFFFFLFYQVYGVDGVTIFQPALNYLNL